MSNSTTQTAVFFFRLTLAVWAVLKVKDYHQRLIPKIQISLIYI